MDRSAAPVSGRTATAVFWQLGPGVPETFSGAPDRAHGSSRRQAAYFSCSAICLASLTIGVQYSTSLRIQVSASAGDEVGISTNCSF
jgi:hypothetical protein